MAQLVPGFAGDRAPIALADTITGGRGASEILIPLPQLLGNDLDLDGDAFVLAELIGPPGVTVEGFDNDPSSLLPDVPAEFAADFPEGFVRVLLDAPLTAPVTFDYRLADAATGAVIGNAATVTIRPSALPTAADDTLRATLGQDNYFDFAALLANDSPGLTFRGIVPGSVTLGDNVAVEDYGSTLRVASFGTTPTSVGFAYEAEDAYGNLATANVTVEVFNRAPVVADGAAVVAPGGTYTLRFADLAAFPGTFDQNGHALSMAFYATAVPSTVTLQGFEDRIEFTFAAGYADDYALDFALADPTGAQDAGRFRFLTTTPAAPVAVADTLRWAVSGGPGEAFGTLSLSRLLANDVIAPGTRVFADFASFTQPAHGILYVEPGNPNSVVPTTDPLNLMLSYIPNVGFSGQDTVTYDLVDEFGRRSAATLTFDVSVPRPVIPETVIPVPAGATSVTFPVSALLANSTVGGPVKFSGYAIRFDEDSGVLSANVDPVTGDYLSFTYTPDVNTVLGQDAFFIGFIDLSADGGSGRGATFVRFAAATGGATVALAAADAGSVLEGNAADPAANGRLDFVIVRSGDLGSAGSVEFALDAAPGSTLTAADVGRVTVGGNSVGAGLGQFTANFAAGQDRVTVSVFAAGDLVTEAVEAVRLTLTGGTGVTLSTTGPLSASGGILNDDLPPPVFTLQLLENVTAEGTGAGNGGTAAFLIRRDPASDLSAATINVAVAAAGTNAASADDLVDGFAVRQIEFPAGADFLTFSLPFVPDALFEPDESVSVALVSSTFGTVDTTPVTAVILNDDAPPPVFTLQLLENVTAEGTGAGNGGTAAFLIRRSPASDLSAATVTVAVAAAGTNPASAADLVDGFAVRQIEFPAGADFLTFSLPFVPDALFEPDESVSVALVSSTFGTVDTTPVTAVILNDDAPPPPVFTLQLAENVTTEGTGAGNGGTAAFLIRRSLVTDLSAATVTVAVAAAGTNPASADDLWTASRSGRSNSCAGRISSPSPCRSCPMRCSSPTKAYRSRSCRARSARWIRRRSPR
ncbi:MAG: hypothetical protein IPK20_22635 [Betaproteobacteria bacterium]|nr:hypothetical protein [Betaproteobacteria bacterium]